MRGKKKTNAEYEAIFYTPCPTCGELHPRGAFSDYEATCECGNKFIVPKAEGRNVKAS